jgi:hypothetical protein
MPEVIRTSSQLIFRMPPIRTKAEAGYDGQRISFCFPAEPCGHGTRHIDPTQRLHFVARSRYGSDQAQDPSLPSSESTPMIWSSQPAKYL